MVYLLKFLFVFLQLEPALATPVHHLAAVPGVMSSVPQEFVPVTWQPNLCKLEIHAVSDCLHSSLNVKHTKSRFLIFVSMTLSEAISYIILHTHLVS